MTKKKTKKKMPVSKEQLGNIIASRAAALCRPELDNAKPSNSRSINEGFGGPSPSDFDGDAAKWDAMFSDSANEDYTPSPRDIQYNEAAAARSSMPAAIKESMIKNKIDTSALGDTSVLDRLGVKGKPMTAPTRKQQMTEQMMQPTTVGGVDYSIIKAIVSECIKEYFGGSMLTEGTLKTIGLKAGKISLVDDKGNIYQAQLKKIGNKNDK